MPQIRICRSVEIPDALRLSRYHRAPELGPRLLFFTGGTALNDLSRRLRHYTHNSIHLVTPFDSGGSSAELRRAFDMPAVGDLRARLMALADDTVLGQPAVADLFSTRLPRQAPRAILMDELQALASGESPQLEGIAQPVSKVICQQIQHLLAAMPTDFCLHGASIGNLILAGGYLHNHRELEPILLLFSKLAQVQGTVRPIVDDVLHLGATLADGRTVIGQHKLTGKEVPELDSEICELFLSRSESVRDDVRPQLAAGNAALIDQADLICYPPGSFFTSLLANLLPQGVGQAIAASSAPKVFVPNLAADPEQLGMDGSALFERLLGALRADGHADAAELVNFILVDHQSGLVPAGLCAAKLERQGVQLVDTRLVTPQSTPLYDPELLSAALLSLSR